jgi:hypothetical protein
MAKLKTLQHSVLTFNAYLNKDNWKFIFIQGSSDRCQLFRAFDIDIFFPAPVKALKLSKGKSWSSCVVAFRGKSAVDLSVSTLTTYCQPLGSPNVFFPPFARQVLPASLRYSSSSALDPEVICRACRYSSTDGKLEEPKWIENPKIIQYCPSSNIAPTNYWFAPLIPLLWIYVLTPFWLDTNDPVVQFYCLVSILPRKRSRNLTWSPTSVSESSRPCDSAWFPLGIKVSVQRFNSEKVFFSDNTEKLVFSTEFSVSISGFQEELCLTVGLWRTRCAELDLFLQHPPWVPTWIFIEKKRKKPVHSSSASERRVWKTLKWKNVFSN